VRREAIVEGARNCGRPSKGDVGGTGRSSAWRRHVGNDGGPGRANERGPGGREVVPASAEIAVLQTDIEVGADRHPRFGEQLPGKTTVASAEFLDAGVSHAAANGEVDAVVAAEIEQTVKHPGQGAHMIVEIERAGADGWKGEGRSGRAHRIQACCNCSAERGVLGEPLDLGAFVAELAFNAEHAKIVSADYVDIIALLPFDVRSAGRRRRKCRQCRRQGADKTSAGCGCSRARRGRLGRLREGCGEYPVRASREQDAAIDSDVTGTIAGHGRSSDHGEYRRRRKQMFTHVMAPFH